MKFMFLIISLSVSMACQSKSVSKEKEVENVEISTSSGDDYYKCHLKTANEFGDRYLKNEIKLSECKFCDSLLLEVINKLSDENTEEKPFWFAILSKMSSETDGYLSEGLSKEAYNFIENNPIQFSKNILSVQKDFPIETNLNSWAANVRKEIDIRDEDNEKSATKEYIKKIKQKISNASTKAKSILISFCKKLEIQ